MTVLFFCSLERHHVSCYYLSHWSLVRVIGKLSCSTSADRANDGNWRRPENGTGLSANYVHPFLLYANCLLRLTRPFVDIKLLFKWP